MSPSAGTNRAVAAPSSVLRSAVVTGQLKEKKNINDGFDATDSWKKKTYLTLDDTQHNEILLGTAPARPVTFLCLPTRQPTESTGEGKTLDF